MARDFKKAANKFAEEFQSKMANGGDDSVAKGIRSMTSAAGSEMQIQYIPLDQIDTFQDHPFRDMSQAKMDELVESIKRNAGTLDPAIVRKKDDGRYEMISGHQRKRACELAGLTEIPVIIRQLTREQAIIQMVDTNIHRDEILPSEKARAYKMRRDAEQRQGKRNDLTSHQVGEKLGTAEKIGSKGGDSQNQVLRYIRLTYLIAPLLHMVDEKKLPFMTGVTLSYLLTVEQIVLLQVMNEESVVPSLQQAEELKKRAKDGWGGSSEEAIRETIREILFPERFAKEADDRDKLQSHLPFALAAQREREEAARREQDAADAAFDAKWAAHREETNHAGDSDEEPLTIVTGESNASVTDGKLHVFFQAAEKTHEGFSVQDNVEKTAKLVCKRLEILQAWFEANTDKDTLDRFLDIVGDLDELLSAQGLLK